MTLEVSFFGVGTQQRLPVSSFVIPDSRVFSLANERSENSAILEVI